MRIIAGKFKGLNLLTFDADNIRPTTDRVRENIFNKIQFLIPNALVLDLFGGTGAVSLEFISRGAERVVTCDNNKKSVELINKNFAKAGIKPELKIGDFKEILRGLKGTLFDIIFLDPPFLEGFGEKAIDLIEELNLLKDDGLIVYEHLLDKAFKVSEMFEIVDERKYGTISVSFIRKK